MNGSSDAGLTPPSSTSANDAQRPRGPGGDSCAPSSSQQVSDNMAADYKYCESDRDCSDPHRDAAIDNDSEVKTREKQPHEVPTCHCHAIPSLIPQHHTPPCLPPGAMLARREIQMVAAFRKNLLRIDGAPAKTQTLRVWGAKRRAEHYTAYTQGKWIRVWQGQGHKATIGWLRITRWDTIRVGGITRCDCIREGRPNLLPVTFARTYFNGVSSASQLLRIQFEFRACVSVCK
jgi:hypothetical protein